MPQPTAAPGSDATALLREVVTRDRAAAEAASVEQQRQNARELVERCRALLAVLARDSRATPMAVAARRAMTRAALARAALRLALIERAVSGKTDWTAEVCAQADSLLAEAAIAAPCHPVQLALNDMARALAAATVTVDDAGPIRDLLQRCMERIDAGLAVIVAEDRFGVDALNSGTLLEHLAQPLHTPRERDACLDRAATAYREAITHFIRVGNVPLRTRAEDKGGALAARRARAAPPPRFCGACGKPVQPGWKFCKACGAPLRASAAH
ncbi:MAG: zinc ribbon domain-containing protein [Xanthobacteraceae bacterium]|nr:zinc ribbon domain-containing protein [Xanthobacteraceae bacterium]